MDSFEISHYRRAGPGGSLLDISASSEAVDSCSQLLSALLPAAPTSSSTVWQGRGRRDSASEGDWNTLLRARIGAGGEAEHGDIPQSTPSTAAQEQALWNSLVSLLLRTDLDPSSSFSCASASPSPSPSPGQLLAWAQGVLRVPHGATVHVRVDAQGSVLSVQRVGIDDVPDLLPASRSHGAPAATHASTGCSQQETYMTPMHARLSTSSVHKEACRVGSETCDMSAVTVPAYPVPAPAPAPAHPAASGGTDSQGTAAVVQVHPEAVHVGSAVYEDTGSMPLSHVYEDEEEEEQEQEQEEEEAAVSASVAYEYEEVYEQQRQQQEEDRAREAGGADAAGTSTPYAADATLARASALGMACAVNPGYRGNDRDWGVRGAGDPREDWQQGRTRLQDGPGMSSQPEDDHPSSPSHVDDGLGRYRLVRRQELVDHAVRLRDAAIARTRAKAVEAAKKKAERDAAISSRWAARQAAAAEARGAASDKAGQGQGGAGAVLARLSALGKPAQEQEDLLDSSLDSSMQVVQDAWQGGAGRRDSLLPAAPPKARRLSHTPVVHGWGGEVASQSQSQASSSQCRAVGAKASYGVALGAQAAAVPFHPSTPLFAHMMMPAGQVGKAPVPALGRGQGGRPPVLGNRNIADYLPKQAWGR